MGNNGQMQYYVVAPDGQKYGPADEQTLAAWARENRLSPTTMLESSVDGSRVPASSVPGIFPESQNPYATPPQAQPSTFANYQRPVGGYSQNYVDTSGEITKAWIFIVLGFFCCFIFTIVGVVTANNARKMGNPNAQAPYIVGIVLLCINALGWIFYLIVGASGVFTRGLR